MLFWIVSIALALAVAGLLALALMRPRTDIQASAAYDLRVYRDQLKDVDRDVARGVIAAQDADRIRTEVSRRILSADAQLQAQDNDPKRRGPATPVIAGTVALVLVAGATGLYGALGAPGYADLPRQLRIDQAEFNRTTRPDQAQAEADTPPRPANAEPDPQFVELMEKLRATLAERPDDLQGHTLLAQNEASLGNFDAAWRAQQDVVRIKGEDATHQDYAELAEFMILAAGGYVSPEAEAVLGQTLTLEPRNPIARYYWGLMLTQIGRPDQAFVVWNRLLRDSLADAPWRPAIEARMPNLAVLAGTEWQPAPPPQPTQPSAPQPGPTREDMDAAAEMAPEDRLAMIQGMVDGLDTRLDEDGGTAEEWARLITALGVLGDTGRAKTVLARAKSAYPDSALIDQAAAAAGVSQ